mmetsp:Transcript_8595/g.33792  ORF Transcript_8595/g.33792 Transcript_8595/m.33792 type:complete len:716 (+) Transcript_8595:516-2663(+)
MRLIQRLVPHPPRQRLRRLLQSPHLGDEVRPVRPAVRQPDEAVEAPQFVPPLQVRRAGHGDHGADGSAADGVRVGVGRGCHDGPKRLAMRVRHPLPLLFLRFHRSGSHGAFIAPLADEDDRRLREVDQFGQNLVDDVSARLFLARVVLVASSLITQLALHLLNGHVHDVVRARAEAADQDEDEQDAGEEETEDGRDEPPDEAKRPRDEREYGAEDAPLGILVANGSDLDVPLGSQQAFGSVLHDVAVVRGLDAAGAGVFLGPDRLHALGLGRDGIDGSLGELAKSPALAKVGCKTLRERARRAHRPVLEKATFGGERLRQPLGVFVDRRVAQARLGEDEGWKRAARAGLVRLRRGIGASPVASNLRAAAAHALAVHPLVTLATPGAIPHGAAVAHLVASDDPGPLASDHLFFPAVVHPLAVSGAAPSGARGPLAPQRLPAPLAPSQRRTRKGGGYRGRKVAVELGVRAKVHSRAPRVRQKGAKRVRRRSRDWRQRPAPLVDGGAHRLVERLLERVHRIVRGVHHGVLRPDQRGFQAVPDKVEKRQRVPQRRADDGPRDSKAVGDAAIGVRQAGLEIRPRLGDHHRLRVLRRERGGEVDGAVGGVPSRVLRSLGGARDGVERLAAREPREVVRSGGDSEKSVDVVDVLEDAVAEEDVLDVGQVEHRALLRRRRRGREDAAVAGRRDGDDGVGLQDGPRRVERGVPDAALAVVRVVR